MVLDTEQTMPLSPSDTNPHNSLPHNVLSSLSDHQVPCRDQKSQTETKSHRVGRIMAQRQRGSQRTETYNYVPYIPQFETVKGTRLSHTKVIRGPCRGGQISLTPGSRDSRLSLRLLLLVQEANPLLMPSVRRMLRGDDRRRHGKSQHFSPRLVLSIHPLRKVGPVGPPLWRR